MIGCHPAGWKAFVWPIPATYGGIWYRRQWFWWKYAVRGLRCWWSGHDMDRVLYEHAHPPFTAWECRSCGNRFAIEYLDYKPP
jgi:hypothetical protein